jgi:uncharacterized membrane protein
MAMISILLVSIVTPAFCIDTRTDPETNRIRALLGGLPVSGWAGWAEVFLFAMDDPRFDVRVTVPHLSLATPGVDLTYAKRVARIYLPRNYESFIGNTDLILLANIDRRIFTPQNIAWFRDGVLDEGMGCLMTGGSQGFGGYGGFPSWGDSVLDEVLPVWCFEGEHSKSYTPKLRIAAPENELAQSIPWEDAPCFFPYNFVEPKDGCTVIIESDDEKRTSLWFYWDIGQGRFVGCQNIFGVFGCSFNEWEYFQDSVLNTYYYTVGFPLPEDLQTAHELRRKWHQYRLELKLLLSLIEFADKFGANMQEVEGEMDELDDLRQTSDELYLENDYPSALSTLEEAISETVRISEMAVEAKERALFWVYVIEWLTVASALIISGSVVWTLMIRRSAYREVKVTRST